MATRTATKKAGTMNMGNSYAEYAMYNSRPAKIGMREKLRMQYRTGYKLGWDSSDTYPKGPMAITNLTRGFHDGLKEKRKYDKYLRKYN